MNDKGLWLCPNCGSTSWEPADTTSMQCQCQYWPPVWTSMVQDWHRAPSGWISVEERLHAKGEYVLAGAMHSWWTLALEPYYPDGSCAWHDSEWMDFKYVTHWQPGPSAPETESVG